MKRSLAIAALDAVFLVGQFAPRAELRIGAETDHKCLSAGDGRDLALSDEPAVEVHRHRPGQQIVVTRVGQLGFAIDVRREHRHGRVVEVTRHLGSRDADHLLVGAAGEAHVAAQAIAEAGPLGVVGRFVAQHAERFVVAVELKLLQRAREVVQAPTHTTHFIEGNGLVGGLFGFGALHRQPVDGLDHVAFGIAAAATAEEAGCWR